MTLLCITFETNINLAPIIAATLAAIIVIIGWFVIAYLNRKNEKEKKLLDYRLDMLKSVMKISTIISTEQKKLTEGFTEDYIKDNVLNSVGYEKLLMEDIEIHSLLVEISEKVLLYGRKKEINIWSAICENINEVIKANRENQTITVLNKIIIGGWVEDIKTAYNVLYKITINNIRKEVGLEKLDIAKLKAQNDK